jgi:hypothetical protein
LTTYKVFASDRFVEARSVYYGTFDNLQEARYAIPCGIDGQVYTANEAGELVHFAYSYEDVHSAGNPYDRWVFCGWETPDGARTHEYQRLEHRAPMGEEWEFRMATGSNFGHVEDPF